MFLEELKAKKKNKPSKQLQKIYLKLKFDLINYIQNEKIGIMDCLRTELTYSLRVSPANHRTDLNLHFVTRQGDQLTAPEQPPIECSTVSAIASRDWCGTLNSTLFSSICRTARPEQVHAPDVIHVSEKLISKTVV